MYETVLTRKTGMNSMDNTLTSILAALGGSVIGASTPVLSNFVLQRSVTQRELTNREIGQREDLYSEFIRQGTACYAKALSQSLENIDEIVAMYALVNRIRLFASGSVLKAAEAFVKTLVEIRPVYGPLGRPRPNLYSTGFRCSSRRYGGGVWNSGVQRLRRG